MKLPRALTPHQVVVEDYQGSGGMGTSYGHPRTVKHCLVEERNRLVRDSSGQETVSSVTVYARPEYGPFTLGSRVTLHEGTPGERTSTIISVAHLHLPPAPEHYELALA